jgi:hypothetical protein
MLVKERGIGTAVLIGTIVVIAAVVAVWAYLETRGTDGESQKVEFNTYTNENYSIKFDYPANWYYQEFSLSGTASFGAFDNTKSEAAIVLEVYDNNVAENLFGVHLDNVINYILSLENRYYENNENYKLIKNPTKIAIDNLYGVSWSATRTSGNTILRFQTEVFVKDNNLYEFVVGCLTQYYSNYERIFENAIDSFSFLD